MKITKLTSYYVHERQRKNFIFVKLDTDEGITGWGEAHTSLDMDTAVYAHAEQMSRYLIGRDPFHIKQFTQVACDDFAWRHGSLEFYSALSGIEMAMWDIVGKALKQPVYNLLGGPCRPRIRVYANGWFYGTKTPADHARAAERTVKQGYTALKCYPFQKGSTLPANRLFPPKDEMDRGVEIVKSVRDAVGPDVDVMVDVCRRLSPMLAVELAERIGEYKPYWFEEPCPIDNIDALAEIRSKVKIPVVSGETLYAKAQFVPVLEKRAVDMLNPDVCMVGGILEMKEIAAMAEPHYVGVSPHNFNSTVSAQAATVHVAATMTNFIIQECFIAFLDQGRRVARQLEVKDGCIELPTDPGLGVEIDERALGEFPYKQFDQRAFRTYKDEGP
jgi:galactonate dehydratase